MRIEFAVGSLAAHPSFERYMNESTGAGAVPLRFECAATSAVSDGEIAAKAEDALERRAREEEAEILPSTIVATRIEEPSGHRRYRILAIARLRRPDVDRVVVHVDADP